MAEACPPAGTTDGDAAVTARQLVRFVDERLRKAGSASPVVEAERLVADVLDVSRGELYLREGVVASPLVGLVKHRLARRLSGVPLQYLAGMTEFCGLRLAVGPATFIPRPETEGLVEVAVACLRGRIRAGVVMPRVLELGTGSGAIALALAARVEPCQVIGVELSWTALRIASANVAAHGLGARVVLVHGDWTQSVRGPFDLIVSNPPYVPTDEIPTLPTDVRHEPAISLDGGVDGLVFYRTLAQSAGALLAEGASVIVECAEDQSERLQALATQTSWAGRSRVVPDLAGEPRVLWIERRALA